jgi:hypothetical protein
MLGAAVALTALWFLIVSRWPGAAEAVVTVRYRRNSQNIGTSVEALRSSLTKAFKHGESEPFDARDYLLGRRRKFIRWVYGFAVLVVPVAAVFVWSDLHSYTVITHDGLVRHSLLASDVFLSWRDVRSVEIDCRPRKKGGPIVIWSVRTADGRTADLTDRGEIGELLPSLLKVDAILRDQGAEFGVRVPPTQEGDTCLEKAGAGVSDFPAFLHVMHRD